MNGNSTITCVVLLLCVCGCEAEADADADMLIVDLAIWLADGNFLTTLEEIARK
jgi:hypothetical protein